MTAKPDEQLLELIKENVNAALAAREQAISSDPVPEPARLAAVAVPPSSQGSKRSTCVPALPPVSTRSAGISLGWRVSRAGTGHEHAARTDEVHGFLLGSTTWGRLCLPK